MNIYDYLNEIKEKELTPNIVEDFCNYLKTCNIKLDLSKFNNTELEILKSNLLDLICRIEIGNNLFKKNSVNIIKKYCTEIYFEIILILEKL